MERVSMAELPRAELGDGTVRQSLADPLVACRACGATYDAPPFAD